MPSDNNIYNSSLNGRVLTNEGYSASFDYNMRTPWRLMFGLAGVIGKQGLISADYEYRGNNVMQASDVDGYVYEDVKSDVKTIYQATHIFRLGGRASCDSAA